MISLDEMESHYELLCTLHVLVLFPKELQLTLSKCSLRLAKIVSTTRSHSWMKQEVLTVGQGGPMSPNKRVNEVIW